MNASNRGEQEINHVLKSVEVTRRFSLEMFIDLCVKKCQIYNSNVSMNIVLRLIITTKLYLI